jgi:hypothetical protein
LPRIERCLLASAAIRLVSTAKPSPPAKPRRDARFHDALEHAPEDVAVAEALVGTRRQTRNGLAPRATYRGRFGIASVLSRPTTAQQSALTLD